MSILSSIKSFFGIKSSNTDNDSLGVGATFQFPIPTQFKNALDPTDPYDLATRKFVLDNAGSDFNAGILQTLISTDNTGFNTNVAISAGSTTITVTGDATAIITAGSFINLFSQEDSSVSHFVTNVTFTNSITTITISTAVTVAIATGTAVYKFRINDTAISRLVISPDLLYNLANNILNINVNKGIITQDTNPDNSIYAPFGTIWVSTLTPGTPTLWIQESLTATPNWVPIGGNGSGGLSGSCTVYAQENNITTNPPASYIVASGTRTGVFNIPLSATTDSYTQGAGHGDIAGVSYISTNPNGNTNYGNALRFPQNMPYNRTGINFRLKINSLTFTLTTQNAVQNYADINSWDIRVMIANVNVITNQTDPTLNPIAFLNTTADYDTFIPALTPQVTIQQAGTTYTFNINSAEYVIADGGNPVDYVGSNTDYALFIVVTTELGNTVTTVTPVQNTADLYLEMNIMLQSTSGGGGGGGNYPTLTSPNNTLNVTGSGTNALTADTNPAKDGIYATNIAQSTATIRITNYSSGATTATINITGTLPDPATNKVYIYSTDNQFLVAQILTATALTTSATITVSNAIQSVYWQSQPILNIWNTTLNDTITKQLILDPASFTIIQQGQIGGRQTSKVATIPPTIDKQAYGNRSITYNTSGNIPYTLSNGIADILIGVSGTYDGNSTFTFNNLTTAQITFFNGYGANSVWHISTNSTNANLIGTLTADATSTWKLTNCQQSGVNGLIDANSFPTTIQLNCTATGCEFSAPLFVKLVGASLYSQIGRLQFNNSQFTLTSGNDPDGVNIATLGLVTGKPTFRAIATVGQSVTANNDTIVQYPSIDSNQTVGGGLTGLGLTASNTNGTFTNTSGATKTYNIKATIVGPYTLTSATDITAVFYIRDLSTASLRYAGRSDGLYVPGGGTVNNQGRIMSVNATITLATNSGFSVYVYLTSATTINGTNWGTGSNGNGFITVSLM